MTGNAGDVLRQALAAAKRIDLTFRDSAWEFLSEQRWLDGGYFSLSTARRKQLVGHNSALGNGFSLGPQSPDVPLINGRRLGLRVAYDGSAAVTTGERATARQFPASADMLLDVDLFEQTVQGH